MFYDFHFAFKLFKQHPLRMTLMSLEIAVGIAAIAMVLSALMAVTSASSGFKDCIFEVKVIETPLRISKGFNRTLIDQIQTNANYIKEISIVEKVNNGFIKCNNDSYRFNGFYAVDFNFESLINLTMIKGNFFSNIDIENNNKVIVISDEASHSIFGTENSIGEKITLYGQGFVSEYDIIGVFTLNVHQKNELAVNFLIPYTSLGGKGNAESLYSGLWITCSDKGQNIAKHELELFFNNKIDTKNNVYSTTLSFLPMFTQMKSNHKYFVQNFGLFFGFLAILATIVSVIGVFSMLMVSIVERTNSLGLKRTFGATKNDIVKQVLSESLLISIIGGFFGSIFALFAIDPIINNIVLKGFSYQFKMVEVSFSFITLIWVVLVVIGIGVLSGIYPAFQAASLTPIDAIRES